MIEADESRDGGDALGVRKQVVEYEFAGEACEERALVVPLDEGAGVLDEFAVLDRGRADGFTGAAVEAFVDVIDEGSGDEGAALRGNWIRDGSASASGRAEANACGGGDRVGSWSAWGGVAVANKLALRDVNHLVDAAAGGVGLQVPEAVGGAGVEAEAAVDTAGVVFVCWVLAGDG